MKNEVISRSSSLSSRQIGRFAREIAERAQDRLETGQRLYGHCDPARRCSEYFGAGGAGQFAQELHDLKICAEGQKKDRSDKLATAMGERLKELGDAKTISGLVDLTKSQNCLDCLEGYLRQNIRKSKLAPTTKIILVLLYAEHRGRETAIVFCNRWAKLIEKLGTDDVIKNPEAPALKEQMESIKIDGERCYLDNKSFQDRVAMHTSTAESDISGQPIAANWKPNVEKNLL